jgi:hypothetical protein
MAGIVSEQRGDVSKHIFPRQPADCGIRERANFVLA